VHACPFADFRKRGSRDAALLSEVMSSRQQLAVLDRLAKGQTSTLIHAAHGHPIDGDQGAAP
jgi:hypothetical protein